MFVIILRWLLFLPASFAGGFLVYIIFMFLSSRYIEPGSVVHFIESLFGGAVSGAAATYIAVYIAPCCIKKGGCWLCVIRYYSYSVHGAVYG